MNDVVRHERAVAQSCQFAQAAAGIGDFEKAVAWLHAVATVDGQLSPEWEAKRAIWAHEVRNGTPRGGGRSTPPKEAAAATRQNGRP